ncbi:uncharacterized protein LOC127123498 [Lathyrus oleraceus]|uniref:uncharacterized protein LOC127123498 n=1 Tax=Pisum sativum TaxID=3888 RepID=UPI0021D1B44B|nr:uncharacterized protein LOC127123498 [Pisum sativum]
MARRNDRAIADALQALANAIANQNNLNHQIGGAVDGSRDLSRFQRNNPPTFKGRCDLEGAQSWLQGIEKIFRVMACWDAQQVSFGTHMLFEEAEYWWNSARQRLEASGTAITWATFKGVFLEKYFSADICSKKEIEFLKPKHGKMIVVDYAAKFEELSRFFPHYNEVESEGFKCIKFESGLRPEIKQCIGYQEIHQFSTLVNKCKIYDEDSHARSSHYKSISDKRSGNHNRNKPYNVTNAKGKQRFQPKTVGAKTQIGGGAPTLVKCFKCGVLGHHALECTALNCYRCGKVGHRVAKCKSVVVTCFNCGEQGHISTHCQKPKKIADTKVQGKVFALSGADASNFDNFIRGTSFINGIPLVTIIDTGAMHSFISADYVKRLNLEVSYMNGRMVIDTPANGSVTTTMICLHCHVTIYGRDFKINLVCLPLSQLDIILGMNWLIFNRVYINYYNKFVLFPEFVIEEDSMFISAS